MSKQILKKDSWGETYLYQNGTMRYIKKLIWFKWKMVKQICSIEIDSDGETFIYYNKWETIKN